MKIRKLGPRSAAQYEILYRQVVEANMRMDQFLCATALAMGIDPKDWRWDTPSRSFVKPDPPAPAEPPPTHDA